MAYLLAAGFLYLIFSGFAAIGADVLDGILALGVADYNTAYYVLLAWLFGASLLTWVRGKLKDEPFPRLNTVLGFLTRCVWYVFLVGFGVAIILNLIGKYSASDTVIYAETSAQWYGLDYIDHDMGSDSYTTPTRQRSPYLRDLDSGLEYRVSCKHEDDACRDLLRNQGTQLKYSGYTLRGDFEAKQARATLTHTIFGKHTLKNLEYVDFQDLPEPFKRHVAAVVVCNPDTRLPFRMLDRYPDSAPMLVQATANASRSCAKRLRDLPVI